MRVTSSTTPNSHWITGHCKVSRVVTQLCVSDQPATRGILMVADRNNTAVVYVSGNPELTADNDPVTGGLPLPPGQPFIAPVQRADEVFLICDSDDMQDVAFSFA